MPVSAQPAGAGRQRAVERVELARRERSSSTSSSARGAKRGSRSVRRRPAGRPRRRTPRRRRPRIGGDDDRGPVVAARGRRRARRTAAAARAPRRAVIPRHAGGRRAVGERRADPRQNRLTRRSSRTLPPFAERLRGQRRQVARATPGGERPGREVRDPPVARDGPLERAAESLRPLVAGPRRKRAAEQLQRPAPRRRGARGPPTFARSWTRIEGMSISTGHTS